MSSIKTPLVLTGPTGDRTPSSTPVPRRPSLEPLFTPPPRSDRRAIDHEAPNTADTVHDATPFVPVEAPVITPAPPHDQLRLPRQRGPTRRGSRPRSGRASSPYRPRPSHTSSSPSEGFRP